jgi:hypothetical protein
MLKKLKYPTQAERIKALEIQVKSLSLYMWPLDPSANDWFKAYPVKPKPKRRSK